MLETIIMVFWVGYFSKSLISKIRARGWHDLRYDVNDLPWDFGFVLIVDYQKNYMIANCEDGKWYEYYSKKEINVMAWKEIKIFNYENKKN